MRARQVNLQTKCQARAESTEPGMKQGGYFFAPSGSDSTPSARAGIGMDFTNGEEFRVNWERTVRSNAFVTQHDLAHMSPAEQRRIKDAARRLYSTEEVRRDLRKPLLPGQSEDFDDVILLAEFLLTGHLGGDLTDSLEWFGERLAIDYPEPFVDPHVIPFTPHEPEEQGTLTARPASSTQIIQTEIQPSHHPALEKNTDNVLPAKKTLTIAREKTLTMVGKKTPTYVPVVLWMVVSYERLREMLVAVDQKEWASPVRIGGLLILLDFMYRSQRKRESKGVLVSHQLASDYVSEHNRPKSKTTLRRPLSVLVKLGILEEVEGYKCGPYQRQSARYRIEPGLKKKAAEQEVMLTPKLAAKQRDALKRQQKRLNKKLPWREQLVHDLGTIGLTQEGIAHSLTLLDHDKMKTSIQRMHDVLAKKLPICATADRFGTILTEVKSFPRELKPHLTLAESNVSLCDITHAHWCLLPILLERKIRDLRDSGRDKERLIALQAEQKQLQDYLSEGDLYQKLSDNPDSNESREKTKKRMLRALNHKNAWNSQNLPYQRMKALFPLTFSVLEGIKRANHKAISPLLHGTTSGIICQSLLRCQELGIPAIPDTDCLICPEEHKSTVCRVIGEEMYHGTGVRCLVGQVRFKEADQSKSHFDSHLLRALG